MTPDSNKETLSNVGAAFTNERPALKRSLDTTGKANITLVKVQSAFLKGIAALIKGKIAF
jgi:hypothetical protein